MATTLLERLLFAQGNQCFFCQQPLGAADASVEHIVARANGGSNGEDNCVACCKSLNSLLGSKSLKEKLRIVLNQKGVFKCPMGSRPARVQKPAKAKAGHPRGQEKLALVVANLRKQSSRPRTLKRLTSAVAAMFQKEKLSPAEVEGLVKALQNDGVVSVAGTKVSYTLSGG